jgi:hypothetical protein
MGESLRDEADFVAGNLAVLVLLALVDEAGPEDPNVDFDRNDLDKTQRIKDSLIREYSIKDLGEAKFNPCVTRRTLWPVTWLFWSFLRW